MLRRPDRSAGPLLATVGITECEPPAQNLAVKIAREKATDWTWPF